MQARRRIDSAARLEYSPLSDDRDRASFIGGSGMMMHKTDARPIRSRVFMLAMLVALGLPSAGWGQPPARNASVRGSVPNTSGVIPPKYITQDVLARPILNTP